MRTSWWTLHLFLATCWVVSLLIFWFGSTGPAEARERPNGSEHASAVQAVTPVGPNGAAPSPLTGITLEAIGTSFVPTRRTGVFAATRLRPEYVLHFPEEMVAPEQIGELLTQGPVALEPDGPLLCRWRDARSLAFVPARDLAPATRHEVLLRDELRSLAGRPCPERPGLAFETARLEFETTVLEEARGSEVRLRLCFSLPLRAVTLSDALEVRQPGKEDPLTFEILGEGALAQPIVRVATRGDELPERLELRLAPGLVPAGGVLGMTKPHAESISLRRELDMHVHSLRSEGLHVRFSHYVEMPAPDTWRFEPAIDAQVVRDHGGLRFHADFTPGTSYALVLEEGFPGRGSARAARTLRRPFLVPDREPEARFSGEGRQFSSRALPELRIEGCNTEKVLLRIRRVYENNVVFVAQQLRPGRYDHVDGRLLEPACETEIQLAGARNERVHRHVALGELLGATPRGFYVCELFIDDDAWYPADRALIQISDLGVSVRAGRANALVRVQRLGQGTPRTGARVRVFSESNQLLAEARTDHDGCAHLHWDPAPEDHRPFVIEADDGSDRSFVDFRYAETTFSSDALSGRAWLEEGQVEAFCQLDRGVVRPGEAAHATILVRDAAGRSPVGRALELRWHAPGGRLVRSDSVELGAEGLATSTLQTDPNSPTGPWQLHVMDRVRDARIGAASLQVEAFVADQIRVEAAFAGELRIGAPGACRVRADWLTGGAATGLTVRAQLRFDAHRAELEGFEGWSFEGDGDAPAPGAIPVLEGVLDENGEALLRFVVPGAQEPRASLAAQLVVEVLQPSGRPVVQRAAAIAWRSEFLGLRVHREADELRVEAALCRPDGSIVEVERDVRLVLEHRRWHRDYVLYEQDRPFWRTRIEREVREVRDLALTAGRGSFTVPDVAPGQGWSVVVLEAGELRAEATPGRMPLQPFTVALTPHESRPASPGTTVTMQLESPITGAAWITLEAEEPLAWLCVPVQAGTNDVALPVPARLTVPNLHVVATVLAPLHDAAAEHFAAAGPRWAIGATSLAIAHPEREGRLTLTAPAELEPGHELVASLTAEGCTRATLAIVDEGVLQVTRHPLPDPLGYFGARRRIATRGCDTGTSLRTELRYPREIATGGDDDSDALAMFLATPGAESTLRHVAQFYEDVRFDAAGRARIAFRVPDFEGTLRLVAIAAGPTRLATAHARTLVRAPISMQVATPRLLAPGDRSLCVLTLRNLSGSPGQLRVRVQDSAGLVLGDPQLATFGQRLEHEERARIELPIEAGDSDGVHTLTLHAELETDGGERFERTLESACRVRTPAHFDHVHRGIAIETDTELRLEDDWQREGLESELVVGTSFAMQLRPVVDALLGYPYGCVEQTASRCRALLAVRALAPELWPEGSGPDVDGVIRGGIERILSMRTYDRGLALWPGETRSYAFGTLHAYEFLLEAREAGFTLPAPAWQAMQDYLLAQLTEHTSLARRISAAALACRAGHALLPHLRSYVLEAKNVDDVATLALALAECGLPDEARALLARPVTRVEERELAGNLRSPVRTLALETRAWFAVAPMAPECAERLQQLLEHARRPELLTTQELGHTAFALAEILRTRAGAGLHPRGELVAGGQRLPFDGTARLRFTWPEDGVVTLRTEGPLYGMLTLRGHRTGFAASESLGLGVERVVLDADTGEPARRFVRGHVYEVQLLGHARRGLPHLLVMDMLPAGFEIENERLGAPSSWRPGDGLGNHHVDRREYRDDRVLLFSTNEVQGNFVRRYRMRAVFAGTFAQPRAMAEALYLPGARWVEGRGTPLVIEAR